MKVLIAQTAFLGDVILATGLLESIHAACAETIDVLVRRGNESLFEHHPFVGKVHVWNKQQGKYRSLLKLTNEVRSERYHAVINLQRHYSSMLLTIFSGADSTAGFASTVLSKRLRHAVPYNIGIHEHEIERNLRVAKSLMHLELRRPRLYPHMSHIERVVALMQEPYVCVAPTSVWFTKQYPLKYWESVINGINSRVYVLGGKADATTCATLANSCGNRVTSVAGRLSLLESVALIANARMNYVNDSAALHMASAVNAPVTAVFCSTVPEFGFGPLSDQSTIVQTREHLSCRPCGIHGKVRCPKGHFACAHTISPSTVLASANSISLPHEQ